VKLRAVKFLTGLLLLPLGAALTMTLWRVLVILAQSPTRLPMIHAFAAVAGIVLWGIIWLFLPPLTRTYVLGHELTHALWSVLMGGKASRLRVSASGGSVRVTKTTRGHARPLFFPAVHGCGRGDLAADGLAVPRRETLCARLSLLDRPDVVVSRHLHGALSAWSQPDIREHGRLFSYTLIYALNILSIAAALIAVSTWSFAEAGAHLLNSLHLLARAAHTLYEWALTRLPAPRPVFIMPLPPPPPPPTRSSGAPNKDQWLVGAGTTRPGRNLRLQNTRIALRASAPPGRLTPRCGASSSVPAGRTAPPV
jgi:hypothetical protein